MTKLVTKHTKKIIILSLVLLNTFAVVFLFLLPHIAKSTSSHIITLTDKGFEPSIITVQKGDTIQFKTKTNQEFWPASNLHPTHTIYPQFDPRKPLKPTDTWSFRFDQEGSWKFHDHLAPLYTGVITVTENIDSHIDSKKINACRENNTQACWESLLDDSLKTGGLSLAYINFQKLFETEPRFAENCHSFTHLIGEAAYKEFKKGKDFPVTQQVAYCSYGFFHGFIEAMMQEDKSLEKARDFCDYIDKKLQGQTSTLGACLHGIGHGVTDGADPRFQGDPQALIKPGLDLCTNLGKNDYEIKICATGVFNALAIFYTGSEHGLKVDSNKPLVICDQQTSESFKHACYDDFKALLMSLTKNDLREAARYLEAVPDTKYAYDGMDNLATYAIYYYLKDPSVETPIAVCHDLQDRLQTACISGLGAGFMTAGIPDEEYIRAFQVCNSPSLSDNEADKCFERVLRLVKLRYNQEKSNTICQTAPKQYQHYCIQ